MGGPYFRVLTSLAMAFLIGPTMTSIKWITSTGETERLTAR
ncbi:hypothetical protein BN6_33150 [Saccharothrix espanaensis DSM 44229]|uniref:Uncharacterized protein n=1 Tax=Saccharothrix espanaensis (strain ATCC 51144 / DSM 44229 / JCM 9112 / NBRC 15066 / NRRL 15764) TaxID=1179773 RepID=K0K197_SACES|nr:hypothetical protein BN6_33150 [Saccharothrix espanaensis DSM 44229]